MPILRYTASADTTITNGNKPYTITPAYYANMGAADSLEIYSIYNSGSNNQNSRILINFPISQISSSRNSGTIPASGSVNFIFKLYNVKHPEILPKNYYAVIRPISSSWDEGDGLDLENYSDLGQSGSKGYGAGWIYRSTTNAPYVWTSYGGDYIDSYSKSFYFDDGTEDIEIDATDIVEAQIANRIPPYGIGVSISGAYEDGTNATTYFTKRFSARSSEYFYKLPALEARWESIVKDDRGDFYYQSNNLSDTDNQQNIYFYNKINGILKNLPNNTVPYVKIYNEDNILLTSSILSTNTSTGVYKASFKITGTVEQDLKDVWYSGSNEYYTGSINAKIRTFEDTLVQEEVVFALTNLKNSYSSYEKPKIKIFGRYKNWSPSIYKIAQKEIETLTFKELYYKIVRIVDNLTIIDYGISPIAYTKCSYDKNGNYFEFDLSILEPGYAYGVKLMLKNEEEKIEYKDIFRFKVE